MSELSIKVSIGGRSYPLTIKRSEEEKIRKAASEINKNLKELKNNYAVVDTQDFSYDSATICHRIGNCK